MYIRQLEYFIVVAETLNFTKASQRFFISQTAVTQQIKALEQEIGSVLFYRNKRHVELTPAGQLFLTEVKAIVNQVNSAITKCNCVTDGFSGTLKIGIVNDYLDMELVEYLRLFHQEYPNIALKLTRNKVGNLYHGLINDDFDLIFNVKFNINSYPHLQSQTYKKSPLLAILPAAHPLAERTSLTRSELKDALFILLGDAENHFGEKESILKGFLESGYLPNNRQYVEDVETILIMVAANMGVSLIPAYAFSLQQFAGRISSIPIIGDEERVEIIAVWDQQNVNPSLPRFLANLSTASAT